MTTTSIQIDRAGAIISLHSEIIGLGRMALDKAIEIGHLLTDQKSSLQHGDFIPWAKANLPFTDRTARNYMQLFEQRDRLKTVTVSDLSDAYRVLKSAAPTRQKEKPESKPLPMLDEVIEGITKSMADLLMRLQRVRRNIGDIQSAATRDGFLLYVQDLREVLDRIEPDDELGEEKAVRKYHLTGPRLSFLKQKVDHALKLLDVPCRSVTPVTLIVAELHAVQKELGKLQP